MQDSNLVYRFSSVGDAAVVASANQITAALGRTAAAAAGISSPSQSASKATDNLAASQDRNAKSTNRASAAHENYIFHIAKTTILSALVNKAFLGMADSAGQAVKQVDLMQNFPAAMGALGLSTKDASDSLLKLRDYAAQTGVSLTDATQTVTRFAEVTKNVKAATAEFIGAKNALIAGGAGTEVQKNALEQLTQAYSRGRPQLIEWKSLMVAMPAQLTAVAKAMKQPSAQALGEQLTSGKISMQDFLTQLTKLSTGTGEIAKQMQARMSGIEFSANLMKNTLTNGLAAIFQAVGRENIVAFMQFLTQVIAVLAKWVVILINDFINLFNLISRVFNGPQIKNFSAGLADAGDGAGAVADGLADGADSAEKINKSLASFDKMNVLPDKTSGKTDPVGQNGIDAGTAKELEDIFGNLGGKLKEASDAAKIFAGILAGLAANALIAKLFGVNPLKELIKGLYDATKGFVGLGKEAEKDGEKVGKSFGTKAGESASKGLGTGISKMSSVLAGAAGGLASVVTETVGPALGAAFIGAFSGIGVAIAAVFGVELAAGVAAAVIGFGVVILAIAAIIAIIWLIWTNWQTIWGFIKGVFDAVWGAIVATWNTLFDIFKAPVEFIWQFITAIFILIVAIVATALELIFKLWVGAWILIYNILSAVAGWIYDNVIKPVYDFFVALWNGIVDAVTAAWNWIFENVLRPIGSWIYNNVIVPVVNVFTGLWHAVSGFFSNIFHDIVNILSPVWNWIYANVIQPIANIFSGLWNGIKTGLSAVFDFIKNIFGSLGGVIKAPINGVIDLINDVLKQLNKVKVPDWVPGLGGKGVNFPMIPKLARGGVVNQATMAMIGESGSEAVMPLENNTEWIDTLASKLTEKAGSGQPVQLVVQIGEDKVVSKVIDLINEKTNMSGRNVIYV